MNFNKIIIIFAIILLAFAGFVFFQFKNNQSNKNPDANSKVTIKNQEFKTELATTSAQQQVGLSGRETFPEDNGLLFIFPRADLYAFWMKDMKFSIDIIFIKDDKIVTIFKDAEVPENNSTNLPLYQPSSPADKVFEINAGLSEKYGFKEGDTVEIKLAE